MGSDGVGGAGGERQHGREYQDNLLHYTEVMTKKIAC